MDWNTILTFIEENLTTIAGNAAIVIAIMKGKYISPAQAKAKNEKKLAKLKAKNDKLRAKNDEIMKEYQSLKGE